MKTKSVNLIGILLILIFSVSFLPQQTFALNVGYRTVNGVIKDKKTKKALEFANVYLPGSNLGTVANSNGQFSLKISDSIKSNTIEFSHIGYANLQYTFKNEGEQNLEILLSRTSQSLDEVIVNVDDARELVRTAIKNIDKNYSSSPNLFTAFYRETVQKRKNYITISEAVIDIYKSPYTTGVDNDRVQVYKGRKIISPKKNDTLAVKLLGGPNLSIFVDVVKNPDLILSNENIDYYDFKLEESVVINGKPHIVIKFIPAAILPYPLYQGLLYIDKESFCISQVEFSLDMNDKNKATELILKKKPYKLRFKPESVSFVINYKEINGVSYLNYVRNEVKFKCDWKRRLFATPYTIVSETVITDKKENNLAIPYNLSFKQSQSLSDKVSDFFDENFWENYNIIEPTESLESAVNKLKKP